MREKIWLKRRKFRRANQKGEILAWGSLGDYHPREGYRITAEISVYAAPEARGKGLGGWLVNFMLERAPELGVKNIVALIFSSNAASLNLFAEIRLYVLGRTTGSLRHGRQTGKLNDTG